MPPRPRIRIFREFSIHSSAEWMTVWDWMAESHWIRWTFIFLKKFSLEERITRVSERKRLTVSREQEPEVSMAMTRSWIFVESRYSRGSRKRSFSGRERP